MDRTREDLWKLAERMDAGISELRHDADNAEAVLTERGYPDDDHQAWGARHADAADAAAAYAERIRTQADAMSGYDRLSEAEYTPGEKVAHATEMGGILIDTRPPTERAVASPWADEHEKQLWASGRHPAQEKAAQIEGSGAFTHVAEPGQIPFWQLSTRTDTSAAEVARATDERGDADEF